MDEDDKDDWKEEVSNINRFRNNKFRFVTFPKNITISKKQYITENLNLPPLEPEGIKSIFRNFTPRYTLDLHGDTQILAKLRLEKTIDDCFSKSIREILIITGKGTLERKGIIKENLPLWLNESQLRNRIIGFSTASMSYGGNGAFFVLLKKLKY